VIVETSHGSFVLEQVACWCRTRMTFVSADRIHEAGLLVTLNHGGRFQVPEVDRERVEQLLLEHFGPIATLKGE
jgi:hypothetical protein